MRSSNLFFIMLGTAVLVFAATGCESNIRPLRSVQHIEQWVPDDPSAPPSTAPAPPAPTQSADTPSAPLTQSAATQSAASTQTAAATATQPATTQPGHIVVTVVDPNETPRFIYKASYDTIWQQSIDLLTKTGFTLDRQDYRLGVLVTKPLPSAQIVEFWKLQHVNAKNAMENTINSQRRTVRLTIADVPGKPDFYEIAVQVLVERQTNPSEDIGGPIFVEGSGFGRNSITLRSDYAEPKTEEGRWNIIGHDPDLEGKLLDQLFQHL